ncbi:MAG: Flagellar secretion chaperone FliS [Fimbriimonadaceae bacterium]|nr:Flagellar secretion chaperone FliS [Fimbriimonadaceae bacterium]
MLYDGALRFIDCGKAALLSADLYRQNDQFQRAQRIITELMACLDMNHGGEVASNLANLYSYAYNQLVAANVNCDAGSADNAAKVLRELRQSWLELETCQRTTHEPKAA